MNELRTVCDAPVEVREEAGKHKIRGYAAVFDSISVDLGGFKEIIRRGAFDASMSEIKAGKRDVSARIQHEGGLATVGRISNGSLKLWVDSRGLGYEIDPPDTQAGRDLVTLVSGGFIDKSSFAFRIRPEGRKWNRDSSPPIQELLSVDIIDVAPVDGPAYEATTVQARSAALASLSVESMKGRASGVEVRETAGGKRVELYFLDQITPNWMTRYMPDAMSGARVIEALAAVPDAVGIDAFINSPGGDVFEAVTIYNTLRDHPAPVNVYVRGLAASAAGLIAMAGDQIQMGPGSFLMIHNAWTMAMGNSADMAKTAALLDKIDGQIGGILASRSGQEIKQVRKWMRDETWFTADEARSHGFADRDDGEAVELDTDDGERCRALGFRNIPKSIGGAGCPVVRRGISNEEYIELINEEMKALK
jgi:HK97 family phage prohead protease